MSITIINNEKSAIIYHNIADENEAIRGYHEMLTKIDDQEDIDIINGIIAEELKHIELLNTMLKKYTDLTAEK